MLKDKTILLSAIIFTMIIYSSCKPKENFTVCNYLVVYDNFDSCEKHSANGVTEIYARWKYPNALILKKDAQGNNNSYENYFMGTTSISGKWEVKGDTLYLYPLYEFCFDSVPQVTKMQPIDTSYIDESRINQKWLIQGDYIYERTDLSVYFDEYNKNGNLIRKGTTEIDNPNNSLRLRSKTKLK